jgi:hypothetical protein
MSYCRWSSDDYQCDLYVYESAEGFVIHVASKRYVFKEDLPPPLPKMPENTTGKEWEIWSYAWVCRGQLVSKMLDDAEMVTIGLPHDGESFVRMDAAEAADQVAKLRALGYNAPERLEEDLMAEYYQEHKDDPDEWGDPE